MRQAMRPAGNAAAAHTLRGEPKRQRDGRANGRGASRDIN